MDIRVGHDVSSIVTDQRPSKRALDVNLAGEEDCMAEYAPELRIWHTGLCAGRPRLSRWRTGGHGDLRYTLSRRSNRVLTNVPQSASRVAGAASPDRS